ncbi:hypothetical protein JQM65_10105 [Faecalicatena contorta]|nr:hypothetical protein [Faecalicatena contorta]
MVSLKIQKPVLLTQKEAANLVGLRQISLILSGAFVNISGEHTEISINYACP